MYKTKAMFVITKRCTRRWFNGETGEATSKTRAMRIISLDAAGVGGFAKMCNCRKL